MMNKQNTNRNGAKKNNRKSRPNVAAAAGTMNLEGLESRQMMSVVNVSNYGAVANDNKDDTAAIKAAISAAKAGDTVKFGAGVYNLTGEVVFQSGETYTGDQGATLKWSGLAQGKYGFIIGANASNVTVTGLKIDGSGIRASDGYYQNVTITNNEITNTAKFTAGVYSYGGGASNLKIENNYFHDYAYWGVLLQGISNSSYSHNVFRNITQGGHILNPKSDNVVSFNVGTGLTRMGLEIQQSYGLEIANQTFNLTVEGNVFYDWNNPYWDSFGLSIMPQTGKNIRVINNYVRATKTADFSTSDSSGTKRWGYGIEYGGNIGELSGNTVIGPWTNQIIVSTQGNVATNNKIYGRSLWGGWVGGEPGIGGKWGTPQDVNNLKDPNMANAPTPPAWAVARVASPLGTAPVLPSPTPTPEPEPESTIAAPTNVKATATVAGQVDLTWSVESGTDSVQIQRKSRDGSDAWVTINTATGATTSYTDKEFTDAQKNNTWAFSYRVIAVEGTDSSNASAHASAQLIAPPAPTPDPQPADDEVTTPTTPTTPTGPQSVYLSDLAETSSKNGFGRFEKDRSNGERGANDGRAIKLNGKTYTKGLGIHAGSEIVYQLDGKWATFVSDVGIDDEIGRFFGSVVFQVWGDGKLLAKSGVMRSGFNPETLKVDVTGVKTMKLVVTDAGNGNAYDHADWAGAQLFVAGAYPPPVTSPTYVSDMQWKELLNGWGAVERDRSNGETLANDGRTLTINGKTYTKGIGTHSGSKLEISLDGSWKTFTTDIGLDDEVGLYGSVTFQVYVDGKVAYDSGVMTGKDDAKTVSVNVQGAQQMWLVVNNGGDNVYFDHADWAGAKLVA